MECWPMSKLKLVPAVAKAFANAKRDFRLEPDVGTTLGQPPWAGLLGDTSAAGCVVHTQS